MLLGAHAIYRSIGIEISLVSSTAVHHSIEKLTHGTSLLILLSTNPNLGFHALVDEASVLTLMLLLAEALEEWKESRTGP